MNRSLTAISLSLLVSAGCADGAPSAASASASATGSASAAAAAAGTVTSTRTEPVGSAQVAAPAAGPKPRYGAVMGEIGRRFEMAGRAMLANRFELAEFEVGEMEEAFVGDLAGAELPKEGPTAALPGLADAFVKTHVPALAKAAKDKDPRAFAEQFKLAAATCNGCHDASEHKFIEISPEPGKPVPSLDKLPAPH